jgi:hypothetical protein
MNQIVGNKWKLISPKVKSPRISPNIYVADYLNLFSDFREMKYKKENVDFHQVKHYNKEKDTIEFFELFFTKYIKYVNINKNSNFIFVMKKITNYDEILYKILESYSDINIRFIIIESKYENITLDKNKDDFLCQYLFNFLVKNNDNCILISNDKYRDRDAYIKIFQDSNLNSIKVIQKHENLLKIENLELKFDISICNSLLNQKYKRTVIPKNKLNNIL